MDALYHPYDSYYHEDPFTQELRMWCLDEQSEIIFFRVRNIPISATWLLPDNVNWGVPSFRNTLIKAYTKKFHNKDIELRGINIYLTKPLCYHDPRNVDEEGNIVRPAFALVVHTKNQRDLRSVTNSLRYQTTLTLNRTSVMIKLVECDPRISLDWKIMCCIGDRGMDYCQWFKIKRCYNPTNVISKVREYLLDANDIIPVQSDKITNPRVMSFDIECFAHNPKAFPKEHLVSDKAYLITCSTKRIGTDDETRRVAILYGDCDDDLAMSVGDDRDIEDGDDTPNGDKDTEEDKGDSTSSPKTLQAAKKQLLPNTKIIKVDSEKKMIQMFEKLITLENPVVITGYNIAGFDWKYLDGRCSVLNMDWSNFSLMKNYDVSMSNITWGSSAYGSVNLIFPDCPGRITFDVMGHVKRNYKLANYRLNTVAGKFLGKKKLDVSAQEMFAAVRAQRDNDPGHIAMMSRVVKYGILDADLPIELFEHHNMWVASVQMSNVVKIPMKLLNMSGQQRRIAALIYKECKLSGFTMNKLTIGANGYKGGHVADPIQGMHRNVVVLDFASLYPSLIFTTNMSYDTYVPEELVQYIPEHEKKKYHFITVAKIDGEKDDDESEDDVGTCEEEKRQKSAKKSAGASEPEEKEVEEEETELHVFYRGRVGVLPTIISNLLGERKRVKKMMKQKDIDSMRKVVLNARQLALKVCCNSIYGFLGASNEMGILPLLPIAKCTTFLGRDSIIRTNNYIMDTWPGTQVVYNDTDSTMFTVDPSVPGAPDVSDYIKFGLMVGEQTSHYLKIHYVGEDDTSKRSGQIGMLDLEFEELVDLMFCIKKKMYVKAYKKEDGSGEIDFDGMSFKGIMLARRNACSYTRGVYRTILTMLMSGCGYNEVINRMIDFVIACRSRSIDMSMLMENHGMGSNYKQKTYFMNMFSNNLAKVGKTIKAGERLDYIVLESVNGRRIMREVTKIKKLVSGDREYKEIKLYKGDKMRLREQIDDMIRDDVSFGIDTRYYSCAGVDNIDTLFSIVFKKEIAAATRVAMERTFRVHNGDSERMRILGKVGFPDIRIRTASYFVRVNARPLANINKIAKLKKKFVEEVLEFDRKYLRPSWGRCMLRAGHVDGTVDWKAWVPQFRAWRRAGGVFR